MKLNLVKIALDVIRGTYYLHNQKKMVSVFGSAQFQEGHPYYQLAHDAGAHLARRGYTVLTGGGPGMMEAANRGAQENGGRSIGCNIILPQEQKPNAYLDRSIEFQYFFIRKMMLIQYSVAFFVLPGGMGTLDELTEIITLMKTNKLKVCPVILIGSDYWQGYLDWIHQVVVSSGAIDLREISFVSVTDRLDEALEKLNELLEKQDKVKKH